MSRRELINRCCLLAIAVALAGPLRAEVSAHDPSLPDQEARRQEQLETERLGFLAARAQRPAEENSPSAREEASPLLADGAAATLDASSKLRGGLAKKTPDAAGPSSLEFWFTGPMPPWILLVGLLLGLSFLTAAWVLHLRSGGARAESRSASARVEASAQRATAANQALAQRILSRLANPTEEAQRRAPLPLARPEAVAPTPRTATYERSARAELPRRFARFTTIDEEPAIAEQEALGAPASEAIERVAARTHDAVPSAAVPLASYASEYAPEDLYEEPLEELYEEPVDRSLDQLTFLESAPEVVPPIRVLSSSVLSHGVPIPTRVERERAETAAQFPARAEAPSREELARKRPKLARRVSLLERSTLELLTNVDRLAGRVEQLTDAVRSAPKLSPAPAPSANEAVELGPWSDPNVALPSSHRAVHPEPFFARLTAQRARERSADPVGAAASKLTAAPKLVAASATPQPMKKPVAARVSEPKAIALNAPSVSVPALDVPVTKATAPKPAVSKVSAGGPEASPLPHRLAEAARVRQVVLKLAREGWDAPRIAREGRIPVRDVHLILKSAGRETGTADLRAPRR